MKNIFLLTGEPKVGKTTALKKIITLIGKEHCGGFLTEEVRDGTERIGFKVRTIEGGESIIADIKTKSSLCVGRYGVDLEAFEHIGIESIYDALKNKKYVIIDEIGPMQLYSEPFKHALLAVAESTKIVIGTIVFRPYEWADDFKLRKNVNTIKVTFDTRDHIPFEIYKMLKV